MSHKDFARFARISKGSAAELLDHLQEAHDCGYITARELDDHDHATRKALKTIIGLLRYLDSTPDQ